MRYELIVARKDTLATGVVGLTLERPRSGPLPAWAPGAHVDLHLADGMIRQYSLCGDPGNEHAYEIAVLREPASRGGSAYVHDKIGPGDTIPVSGPRNHFRLEPAQRLRFIAGGIGITPIRPMIAAAVASGIDWQLLYGGRTRESMAFLDELSTDDCRVRVAPQDETGLLDLEAFLGPVPREGTLVYCCGPEPLLAAAEAVVTDWSPGALRVERFAPLPEPAAQDRTGFTVECRKSGLTLIVPPDKSILEVVREAGIDADSNCREGTCGTCETAVLDGIPEHHDVVLSDDEKAANDTMMICVGRATSDRLVLDL